MLWDVNFLWQGKRCRTQDEQKPVEAETAEQALRKYVGRHFPSRQVGLISSVNLKEGTWHAKPLMARLAKPVTSRPLTKADNFLNWPAMKW